MNWTNKIPPFLAKHDFYFSPRLKAPYLLAVGTSLSQSGDMPSDRRTFAARDPGEPGVLRA
ncbi:MAG: hypothetical protein ABI682_05150 [Acidobacteriota bacterium]